MNSTCKRLDQSHENTIRQQMIISMFQIRGLCLHEKNVCVCVCVCLSVCLCMCTCEQVMHVMKIQYTLTKCSQFSKHVHISLLASCIRRWHTSRVSSHLQAFAAILLPVSISVLQVIDSHLAIFGSVLQSSLPLDTVMKQVNFTYKLQLQTIHLKLCLYITYF